MILRIFFSSFKCSLVVVTVGVSIKLSFCNHSARLALQCAMRQMALKCKSTEIIKKINVWIWCEFWHRCYVCVYLIGLSLPIYLSITEMPLDSDDNPT